jgi:protein TonB
LKDLLPPVYQAYSERRGDNEPPRLNTQDPKSASFFTSVKQAIDANWVYPAMALRYGLEGKLLLEFTILQNGQLDEIRLIRSSGSSVLDQEAIRAVQAAAPFRPIPSWIKARRLVIPFSFTYEGAAEARLRSTMSDATAVR